MHVRQLSARGIYSLGIRRVRIECFQAVLNLPLREIVVPLFTAISLKLHLQSHC